MREKCLNAMTVYHTHFSTMREKCLNAMTIPHSLFDNERKMLKCDVKAALLTGMEATVLSDPVVIRPTTE